VLTVRQLLVGSDALTLLSPAQLAVELDAGCWPCGPRPCRCGTIGMTHRALGGQPRRRPISWPCCAQVAGQGFA
jgi:hypothetical protein